jgi:hypothetical protein
MVNEETIITAEQIMHDHKKAKSSSAKVVIREANNMSTRTHLRDQAGPYIENKMHEAVSFDYGVAMHAEELDLVGEMNLKKKV